MDDYSWQSIKMTNPFLILNNYFSLIRFSHTVFALPFAIIGFILAVYAEGYPFRISSLALIVLCMVFARSAAMAFNRYADRDIDKTNPRTASREMPRRIISPRSALIFIIANVFFFILTTYFINRICFALSPVAIGLILFYSYTKRFTRWCHLVLGLSLSLAPIGAFLAVTGQFQILPLLFAFVVLFWVSGFDILYALPDEQFDRGNKLHSVPGSFGRKKALSISRILHLICALLVIWIGLYGGFGKIYWAGSVIFIALLAYQQQLITPNDISKVNLAFATANGIASVVFATFVCMDLYFK